MRIIGGKHRSRKIIQPEFDTVRPTKDRVRESVFNMISTGVQGSRVLDLFSGSGAYGLESLSRGSERVLFVDSDKRCCDIIDENVRTVGEEDISEVWNMDSMKAIEKLGDENQRFNIVFSDPPYNIHISRKTLIMINQYDILMPSGLLVIEHHAEEDIPEAEGDFSIYKQKTYGDITISIFRKND